MNLRTNIAASLLAAFVAGAAGCGGYEGPVAVIHGPEEGASGEISLALSSSEGALTDVAEGKVMDFRVRIFRSTPESWDDSAYFHSDCGPVSTAFKIDHLATGVGFVVVYEGYAGKWSDCTAGAPCQGPDGAHPYGRKSDGSGGFADCDACNRCESPDAGHPNGRQVQACLCEPDLLVDLGVRGGISISEAGTGDAFYYIQVNKRNAFTPFPLPGPALTTGGTTCNADEDCTVKVDCAPDEVCADGTKYLVHPKAECVDGVCKLLSLFPLNARESRAFHTAVSDQKGVVTLLGGFNASNATQLAVHQTTVESFDSSTAIFANPEIDGFGNPPALANAVDLGSDRVALIGGASMIKGLPNVLIPNSKECDGTAACAMDATNRAFVLDLSQSRAESWDLPFSVIGAQAALVGLAGGQKYLFVRPGVIQESPKVFRFGTEPYLFTVGDDGTLACAVTADGADPGDTSKCLPLSVSQALEPRAWASGACLKDKDGVCSEYLVFGGNSKNKGFGAFAEVYLAELGSVQRLAGDGSLPPTLVGARAIMIDGRVWSFGGLTADGPPDSGPIVYEVDATGSIKGYQAIIAPDDRKALERILHSATLLSDGKSVLIAGGYRADAKALDTWVVAEVNGNNVKIVARGTLSTGRAAHEATIIRGGLLQGSVLVTGGVASLGAGTGAVLSPGAEIFLSLD